MAEETKPVYEQALDVFRQELKMAILSEEIPMTFEPDDHPGYFADVVFKIRNQNYRVAVAETYACYMNPVMEGLFDPNGAEWEAFKAIIRKHVKVLTEEDRAKIAELQAEIDRIKGV